MITVLLVASLIINFTTFAYRTQATSPLQHIIFIIQENHSFDNYFGTYPGVNGFPAGLRVPFNPNNASWGYLSPFPLTDNKPVFIWGDELAPGEDDPDDVNVTQFMSTSTTTTSMLTTLAPYLLMNENLTSDIPHGWAGAHCDWDNGKMDGFLYCEGTNETLGYYDRRDIPYYWDYADNFVLDDNFFSSMMGPSLPNHLYIASGANGPTNLTQYTVTKPSTITSSSSTITVSDTFTSSYDTDNIFSGGVVGNLCNSCGPPPNSLPPVSFTWETLAEELSAANVSWTWYAHTANPSVPNIWDVLPLF